MMRIAQFSLEDINHRIGLGKPKFTLHTHAGAFKVKASSHRLECLKRNQACVRCHLKGTIWVLECSVMKQPTVGLNCFVEDCPWCAMRRPFKPRVGGWDTPHLNLYARDRRGRFILMTQDHIMPKHAGGSDDISNLQTMCRNCNSYKGGMLPHEYAEVMLPHERTTNPGRVDERGTSGEGLPSIFPDAPHPTQSSDCAAE